MSVTEYENKFTSLSRFAPEMVSNEVDKVWKFISGLDYKMRPLLIAQGIKVYFEVVERTLMLEMEAKDKNAKREQWRQKRNARPSAEGPSGKKNRGVSFQFQGQQFARSAPTTPMPATSAKGGVICYRCNQPGHYKSECPQISVNFGVCFGCGQQGHKVKNCPNQGAGTGSGRGSQQRPSQSTTVQSGFRPPPSQPAMSSQGSRPVRRDTPTMSVQQSGEQISSPQAQAP
ncbi:uncharacterized protein LOC132284903 [Cornus florida]|uniref:uncharacterized protein LOC132284903 n=1 Tax=Cornus florida TaxID=4283 RepID=UPI002899D6C6|nr:uncharacterized protein LOC132284903 [Cornus florida]